jgi:hypothetical protein
MRPPINLEGRERFPAGEELLITVPAPSEDELLEIARVATSRSVGGTCA